MALGGTTAPSRMKSPEDTFSSKGSVVPAGSTKSAPTVRSKGAASPGASRPRVASSVPPMEIAAGVTMLSLPPRVKP